MSIRNPYEAVISWWNHLRSEDAAGKGLEVNELKKSLQSEQFCRFAKAEATIWTLMNLDVITLSVEVLVVQYEDMIDDNFGMLEKVMAYLGVPEHKSRTECVKRFPPKKPRKSGKFLTEEENPFCPEAIQILDQGILDVDSALRERGLKPLRTETYKYYHKSTESSKVRTKNDL